MHNKANADEGTAIKAGNAIFKYQSARAKDTFHLVISSLTENKMNSFLLFPRRTKAFFSYTSLMGFLSFGYNM